MAANIDPIFTKNGKVQGALVVTAPSTVYNISGTIGTDIYKVFEADATNGSFVGRLRIKYTPNATTASNAAVLKVWLSSVTSGTPTLGTQAWLIDEIALPATGALSTTTTSPVYEIPIGFAIPAGYCILAVITVSQPASCGWTVCAIGSGDY